MHRAVRRGLIAAAAIAAVGAVGALAVAWRERQEEPPDETVAFGFRGLSTPLALSDPTPRLGGRAGPGASVKVRVYAGRRPRGRRLRTLTARADSDGRFQVELRPALPTGTYTVEALSRDGDGETRRAVSGPVVLWRHTAAAPGASLRGTFAGRAVAGVPGPTRGPASAVSFDGVDDSLVVPDSGDIDVEEGVTISLWMRRARFGSWQVLVGKPGDGRSKLENYAVWLNETDRAVAFFGDGREYVRVETPAPLDGRWHHLAASYDNRTARIYVDGALAAAGRSTVRLTPNDLPLNVGRANGNGNFFAGLLDRVEVYRVSLAPGRVRALYRRTIRAGKPPPAVSLTTPEPRTSTSDPTPAFAGMAGTTALDARTVTVKLYRGATVARSPLQTIRTARLRSGAWGVSAPERLPAGTYTAQAEQVDAAGNVGLSTANTFRVVGNRRPRGAPVILGAGDIADCSGPGDEATSDLLSRFSNATVLTFGDNAYDDGTPLQFRTCYDRSWGRVQGRTRPTLGGHDYGTPGAAGYFAYFRRQLAPFGATATDPLAGYYSYDLGEWHVVHTNTECVGVSGCDVDAQIAWLRADLRENRSACTLAITHNPRWSSGSVHGDQSSVRAYWQAFYELGVDVVLSGDDHDYERFAPQNPSGLWDPLRGVRTFVVGTGGYSHYRFAVADVRANSEVRNDDTFGVIRLTLRRGSYEWDFLPQAGKVFTDSGSDACH